jgi:virginiamycin B lyase
MRTREYLLTTTVIGLCLFTTAGVHAQTAGPAALTGVVSSAEEGAMEGVVVSARKDGSTITTSVVSDNQGRYAFPAARLEPGHYTLKMRATGYDLAGTNAADIAPGKQARSDLKLTKTKNITAQMSNADWLISMPGTDEQKKFLLGCIGCHTLERVVKSTYDTEGFLDIFERMSGYYPGTTPQKPQRLAGTAVRDQGIGATKVAEWLASVNLSKQAAWPWALKTLPRPKGKSTHVIFTEYDLPKPAMPHDVIVDREGTVWYSDFGQLFLGKMDAKTGKVTQYPMPKQKEGWPVGSLDLELDRDGNVWLGMMYQGAVARFDKKTQKFRVWNVPKEWDTDAAQLGHLAVANSHVDNKVWIKNSDGTNIYRLDLVTNKFENLGPPIDPTNNKKMGTYGIHSDAANNAYLLNSQGGDIARIDAKTKVLTVFRTPTPGSAPRRGRVDAQGRLWFAEFRANSIGMLDTKTGTMKEFKAPTPWSAPYDANAGRDGKAWTGSMVTNNVLRLDIASGQYTEYMLPHPTNIRRIFVDDRQVPSTLWLGNNHFSAVVKVEPLD